MAEIKTYTPQGFKALQDELDYLVNVKVEENKKEISTARAFGDLSENSEYDEAKAEQGKIHTRIAKGFGGKCDFERFISHELITVKSETLLQFIEACDCAREILSAVLSKVSICRIQGLQNEIRGTCGTKENHRIFCGIHKTCISPLGDVQISTSCEHG